MPTLQAIPATRLIFFENDPGIPVGRSADPFAGLFLTEARMGKSIGTASMKGNIGERDAFMRNLPRQAVQQAIQRASRNAPRALAAVYSSHRMGLVEIVTAFVGDRVDVREARLRSAKMFRTSYERVREIARRASGVEQLAVESVIYAEEEKWFRSAVREEISYFHGLLEDISNQRAHNVQTRIEGYVRALRFMYEAARIQAMPDNVLLYWTGPRKRDDPKVCEGCEYLMERSPFPKDTIPSVPRDGMTQCLTNCRHRILVRVVRNLNEVVARRHALGKRDKMIRKLNTLKEEAGLGRAAPRVTGTAKNPFKGTPLTKARARTPSRREWRGR